MDAEGEKLKIWCCANHTLDWTDVPRIGQYAKSHSPNSSFPTENILWSPALSYRLKPSIR